MTQITDLKGHGYPRTLCGISSIVGDLPWHYGTEDVNIAYPADPDAIAAHLPEPLALVAERRRDMQAREAAGHPARFAARF